MCLSWLLLIHTLIYAALAITSVEAFIVNPINLIHL